MDKRYQVFVSSTYADLKQERQRVIQALMEMDCIPAGMELFPAADEEQWDFIRRVIDDCDYYLLIIGGRYGSTTPEGVSYTEKEYDYAIQRGIKVIALIHEKPEDIPLGKSEIDPELRERLEEFRKRVAANRLVKFWTKADELPGLVALSLSKTIKTFPAVGWVRASGVANEELLSEVNDLRKENDALREDLAKLEAKPITRIEGLAGLDETFCVNGTYSTQYGSQKWTSKPQWREIFAYIAPYLLEYPTHDRVKEILTSALVSRENSPGYSHTVLDQGFQTITVQLRALGLVNVEYQEAVQGGMGFFWSLTPQGERLMLQLRTVPPSK
jgi:hypothetical protein